MGVKQYLPFRLSQSELMSVNAQKRARHGVLRIVHHHSDVINHYHQCRKTFPVLLSRLTPGVLMHEAGVEPGGLIRSSCSRFDPCFPCARCTVF